MLRVTWDELAEVAPEDFTVATMPARFAEVGDRHATIDEAVHSLQPLLALGTSSGTIPIGRGEPLNASCVRACARKGR